MCLQGFTIKIDPLCWIKGGCKTGVCVKGRDGRRGRLSWRYERARSAPRSGGIAPRSREGVAPEGEQCPPYPRHRARPQQAADRGPAGRGGDRPASAPIHPLSFSQLGYYHDLGLRQRALTLPVVLAVVLSMVWRQVGSVRSAVLLLEREGFLWTSRVRVSPQALLERLRTLPAELFRRVLLDLLPTLEARWRGRSRPLPPEVAWAMGRYTAVLGVDGSTLDALLRKVGLLRERPDTPLAGRMTALLHIGSRLPAHLWYEPDPQAHDQRAWDRILAALPAGTPPLFDLGYTSFARFAQLTAAGVTFVTRAKSNLAYTASAVLRHTGAVHDDLVWVGGGADRQQLRLISVLHRGTWHRYLTNETDPGRLPVLYAAPLSTSAGGWRTPTPWSSACSGWPTSGAGPRTPCSSRPTPPGSSTPSSST